MIADRGYDADWLREALKDKGIRACLPGRKTRAKPIRHDKRRYRRRNRIEIMFGRLKDFPEADMHEIIAIVRRIEGSARVAWRTYWRADGPPNLLLDSTGSSSLAM